MVPRFSLGRTVCPWVGSEPWTDPAEVRLGFWVAMDGKDNLDAVLSSVDSRSESLLITCDT